MVGVAVLGFWCFCWWISFALGYVWGVFVAFPKNNSNKKTFNYWQSWGQSENLVAFCGIVLLLSLTALQHQRPKRFWHGMQKYTHRPKKIFSASCVAYEEIPGSPHMTGILVVGLDDGVRGYQI